MTPTPPPTPDDKLLPDDEPVDEDEENDMECGITPDGLCQLAGTEWCDWHCKGNLR